MGKRRGRTGGRESNRGGWDQYHPRNGRTLTDQHTLLRQKVFGERITGPVVGWTQERSTQNICLLSIWFFSLRCCLGLRNQKRWDHGLGPYGDGRRVFETRRSDSGGRDVSVSTGSGSLSFKWGDSWKCKEYSKTEVLARSRREFTSWPSSFYTGPKVSVLVSGPETVYSHQRPSRPRKRDNRDLQGDESPPEEEIPPFIRRFGAGDSAQWGPVGVWKGVDESLSGKGVFPVVGPTRPSPGPAPTERSVDDWAIRLHPESNL